MIPLLSLLADDAASCSSKTFLGLVPWYHYLSLDGQCQVQNFTLLDDKGGGLALISLAIVDDMLRLAGLIAVGFVIYGGVMYATSQGEPDKAKQAQSTIINALVGLAIALIAVAFVSFIGNRLGQ